MVLIGRKLRLFTGKTRSLWTHQGTRCYVQPGRRGICLQFDPVRSYQGYFLPVSEPGSYRVLLTSDDGVYGGFGRVAHKTYTAKNRPTAVWASRSTCPQEPPSCFRKFKAGKNRKKGVTTMHRKGSLYRGALRPTVRFLHPCTAGPGTTISFLIILPFPLDFFPVRRCRIRENRSPGGEMLFGFAFTK